MLHLCNDCGAEFSDDICPDFDAYGYGCPVCGSHDFDDEAEGEPETGNGKPEMGNLKGET